MNLKKQFTLLSTISVLITILSACSLTASSNNAVSVRKLSFPDTLEYYSLAQTDNTLIAFGHSIRGKQYEGFAEEGNETGHELALPGDPKCSLSTGYSVLGAFPDGRLQIWKWCHKKPKAEIYLMAYDWDRKVLEEITGPLPVGPTSSSWNSDQTKGIASFSDAFASGTLYWMWPGGYGPLDLTITDNGRSWNAKDDFPDFQGSDAGTTGNIGMAAWSSDGHSIAFFASPDAIAKTDASRFSVEYKICSTA